MITIKRLGTITKTDIEKIQPVENGLAIHDYPTERLTDEVKEKICTRLNISSVEDAYLVLYINIFFEDECSFYKGISLSLIFDNGKDYLSYSDFYISDAELLELKQQIIVPYIMKYMKQVEKE